MKQEGKKHSADARQAEEMEVSGGGTENKLNLLGLGHSRKGREEIEEMIRWKLVKGRWWQ